MTFTEAKNKIFKDAKKHGVKIKLIRKKLITAGGIKTSGVFSPEPEPVIEVATGKGIREWMSALLHEYCHMKQWLQNVSVWKSCYVGPDKEIDVGDIIDMWLDGLVELNDKQLKDYVYQIIRLEKDCERRTIALIKKWKLTDQINPAEYVQEANAYLFFYWTMASKRKWYRKSPSANKKICKAMPTTFRNDYSKMPKKYKKLFDEIF